MTEKETTKSSLERTLDLTISAEQLKAREDRQGPRLPSGQGSDEDGP